MAKLDDCVLAKLKREDHNFEVYVDPYLAWDFSHGKDINFDDLLGYEAIYTDAKKGKEASEENLNQIFNTTDVYEVTKEILKHGEIPLTTAQKHDLIEKRKNEVISYFTKNANDPKTKAPIPQQRIENALEKLNFKFDISKPKEKEINEVYEKLKREFPISLEKIIVTIQIPATYSGRASGIIHKYNILDEKWMSDGQLFAKIKIPSGEKNNLVSEINNITHGAGYITVESEE